MSIVNNSFQENKCCKKEGNFIQKHGLTMLAVALVVAQVAVLACFYATPYFGVVSLCSLGLLSGVESLIFLKKRSIQKKSSQQKLVAQPLPQTAQEPKRAAKSEETKPVDKFAKCIKIEEPSRTVRKDRADAGKKGREEARLDMAMDRAADSEAADQADNANRAKEKAREARLAAQKGL